MDWAAQRLYWINSNGKGKLVRSNFNGSTDTLIDEHDDYDKVRSMVVDRSISREQTYNPADSSFLVQEHCLLCLGCCTTLEIKP